MLALASLYEHNLLNMFRSTGGNEQFEGALEEPQEWQSQEWGADDLWEEWMGWKALASQ